jgi:hypothetical protein
MRALVVLVLVASTRIAVADRAFELGIRGAGSLSIDEGRNGVAPSVFLRAQRRLGVAYLGINVVGGLPAYFSQLEASIAAGFVHTIREGRCVRADLDADEQCDARLLFLGGIDAGIAMFYFDAPPEMSSTSDGLVYWGPLVRARGAFRATWPTPSGKQLGFTIGAGVAFARAYYLSDATGDDVRIEPEIDIAGVIVY